MPDTLPAELSKVDPQDAWRPYSPSATVPWNRKWITHLFRRAAFGATPAEVEQATKDGFEKTLHRLITGEPEAAERLELYTETGQYYNDPLQLRVWWLSAMMESGHPLREKLTLFWHNHFATSYAKVRSTRLMFDQNVTLRKHALGHFRPFLLDVSRDPAMLVWLDSNSNAKGKPNENYAREVMELFSLGVGHYTEKDIQEAARAFTGWHVDSIPNRDELRFEFKDYDHDFGPKTVFGHTGNWNGDDVVRLCCDKPECAPFLAGKLYAYLVSETPPPQALLAPLVERFRKTDYDIADLVRMMLGSRLFFSEHAYRKRVKWPVEYALLTVRSIVPDRAPLGDLLDPLAKMGQPLFAPPNVKGWRTGTDWLNSATLLARNNFAESVATANWARLSLAGRNQNAKFATVAKTTTPPAPAAIVDYPMDGSAAAAGAPSAVTFPTVDGPEGKPVLIVPVEAPGGPGGPPGAQPPGVIGPATNQAPNPDSKLDVIPVLFATKPKSADELVSRMAELLYGADVPPTVRTKVRAYLLGSKKEMSEADLESKEFRQKAREALHALMCLPEYQLG
jgi:hypothetical protein